MTKRLVEHMAEELEKKRRLEAAAEAARRPETNLLDWAEPTTEQTLENERRRPGRPPRPRRVPPPARAPKVEPSPFERMKLEAQEVIRHGLAEIVEYALAQGRFIPQQRRIIQELSDKIEELQERRKKFDARRLDLARELVEATAEKLPPSDDHPFSVERHRRSALGHRVKIETREIDHQTAKLVNRLDELENRRSRARGYLERLERLPFPHAGILPGLLDWIAEHSAALDSTGAKNKT